MNPSKTFEFLRGDGDVGFVNVDVLFGGDIPNPVTGESYEIFWEAYSIDEIYDYYYLSRLFSNW